MRIGIDAWYLSKPYSSIGKILINTLEHWKKIKSESTEIILFSPNTPHIETYKNEFDIVTIPTRNILKFYWSLNKKVKEKKLDIFFFPFDISPFYSGKYILMIHDLIFQTKYARNIKNFFFSMLVKDSVKRTKKIITPSKFTKEEIIKKYKLKEEIVRVLYLGVDPVFRKVSYQKAKKKICEELNILPPHIVEKGFIIHAGRIKPAYKNLFTLLKAYINCKDKIGKYLLIVSTDKPSKSEERIIKKYKDNIILLHNIPDEILVLLYNLSEFFVYPSFYEGFGMSSLEAMACGKPIIASNIPPFLEVIGDAGIFFNPYNTSQLSKALVELSLNENLRKELSKRAEKRAKLFSWEKFSKKLLELLITS